MSDAAVENQQNVETNIEIPAVLNWLMRFYIMLMIPLVLAVGSARLMMNPALLSLEYNRAGFPIDEYGFSSENRITYGPYGVLYITNNEPLSYLSDLELPGELCFPPSDQPCIAFNSQELSHMEDVQVVAQGLFRVAFWGGLVALVIGFILYRVVGLSALRLALMQGSLLAIGLIVAIILLAITVWDTFFGGFHGIFFEDGTWQFFYSDTLIRLYPEQFWFDAALVVGGLSTIGAIIILGISWVLPPKRTV